VQDFSISEPAEMDATMVIAFLGDGGSLFHAGLSHGILRLVGTARRISALFALALVSQFAGVK